MICILCIKINSIFPDDTNIILAIKPKIYDKQSKCNENSIFIKQSNDPQPCVVHTASDKRNKSVWTAICVQNVNVHVSCSSHVNTQFAAFFIDPQAK